MRKVVPASVLLIAMLIDTLLCGFAAGAILISTGVSFYQGWAGITITTVTAVTEVALAGGPTYLPPPTYTVLPTYTPYPTYTMPAAELLMQMQAGTPEPQEQLDAAQTPQATLTPGGSGQAVTYVVQEGDTLESIAAAYGVEPADIINANGLSPENPVINVGDVLTIPITAQVTATAPVPTLTNPVSTAAETTPADQPTPTATSTPAPGEYPAPTLPGTLYPNAGPTTYP